MALTKVVYVDGTTVIAASNLNAIQDAIIALENAGSQSTVLYVSQTLTDGEKAQARTNIGAASIADLGTVFDIKGDVATVNDLPASGNRVGDVYYVQSVSAAFVWLETTAHPTGYWEEFGEPIDLSGYVEKPLNATDNQIMYFNGTSWAAKTETPEVTISTAGDVTQSLDPGKIYHFTGAVSSLTLTLTAAASGQIAQYHFDFNSGSTAATVSITGVTWQSGSFTPAASKHYEVDILNGYGVVCEW